jgi:hypothetical protein
VQIARTVVEDLRRGQSQLETHDIGQLLRGGRRRCLRMYQSCISLVR